MLSTLIYPLLVCFTSTLLAKPLQVVNDQTLQSGLGDLRLPSQPSQPSSVLSNSNATSSPFDALASNELSIKCDGQKYGFKPDVEDCASALRRQKFGRIKVTFGQRGSVSTEKFSPLPYRLMGNEARCYFEPVLNGAHLGKATLSQIREATSDLLLTCASRAEQGGIATNLGGDNSLSLILSTYKPDVECRGSFPDWKSCTDVLGEMPASTQSLVFGPVADPHAQVLLPQAIESDDSKCLSRIWYTKKESDTASWFKIWEAMTAVFAVCTRNQQSGIIRGLGDHGNLFLTMTPQVSSSGNLSLDDKPYEGEVENLI